MAHYSNGYGAYLTAICNSCCTGFHHFAAIQSVVQPIWQPNKLQLMLGFHYRTAFQILWSLLDSLAVAADFNFSIKFQLFCWLCDPFCLLTVAAWVTLFSDAGFAYLTANGFCIGFILLQLFGWLCGPICQLTVAAWVSFLQLFGWLWRLFVS